jgi:hypothetical protein
MYYRDRSAIRLGGTTLSSPGSSSVASKEEIEAALAQADALSFEGGDIPDLDDDSGKRVVPIPVSTGGSVSPRAAQTPTVKPDNQSPSASPSATDIEQPSDSPGVAGLEQPSKFTIAADPEQPADSTIAADATAAPAEQVASDSSQPKGRLGRLFAWMPFGRRQRAKPAARRTPDPTERMNVAFRAVDLALDLVNRPFARLETGARRTIAIVGVMTIVMSLVAGYLGPRLIQHNDAISLLQRKRAALLSAPAPAAAQSPVPGAEAQTKPKH